MTKPLSNSRRFVNAAWSLLTFQLIASAGAVGVTGLAAFHVRDLIASEQASANQPGTLTLNDDGSGNINALLSDPNGISGAPPIQWLRDGVPIHGVSGATYAVQRADLGSAISARADYVDDGGYTESVVSQPLQIGAPPLPPSNQPGALRLTLEGGVVSAALSDENGITGAPRIQWLRNGEPIAGATGWTYAVQEADSESAVSARADYVDDHGFSESVVSQPVRIGAIRATPPQAPACARTASGFRVDARVGWCDTGVALQRGQRLNMCAGGRWSNGGEYRGPAGFERYRLAGTVVADADLAALVGRVGDATFAIGGSQVITSPANGTLQLSINDVPGTFDDNQGSVEVGLRACLQ